LTSNRYRTRISYCPSNFHSLAPTLYTIKKTISKCKINLQLHILIKLKMLFLLRIKTKNNAKIPLIQTNQTKIENAAALKKSLFIKKTFKE